MLARVLVRRFYPSLPLTRLTKQQPEFQQHQQKTEKMKKQLKRKGKEQDLGQLKEQRQR